MASESSGQRGGANADRADAGRSAGYSDIKETLVAAPTISLWKVRCREEGLLGLATCPLRQPPQKLKSQLQQPLYFGLVAVITLTLLEFTAVALRALGGISAAGLSQILPRVPFATKWADSC